MSEAGNSAVTREDEDITTRRPPRLRGYLQKARTLDASDDSCLFSEDSADGGAVTDSSSLNDSEEEYSGSRKFNPIESDGSESSESPAVTGSTSDEEKPSEEPITSHAGASKQVEKESSNTAARPTPPPTRRVRGRGAVGHGMYADSDSCLSYEDDGLRTDSRKRNERVKESRPRRDQTDHPRLFDYKSGSSSPRRPRPVGRAPVSGSRQISESPSRRQRQRKDAGKSGNASRIPTRNVHSIESPDSRLSHKLSHRRRSESPLRQGDRGRRTVDEADATGARSKKTTEINSDLEGPPVNTLPTLKETYKRISAYELALKGSHQAEIISRSEYSVETIRRENARKLAYCKLCISLIKHDYKLGVKYDLETRLWRNGVYKGIEQLRRNLQTEGSSLQQEVRVAWLDFIENAEALYTDAILAMKATWDSKASKSSKTGSSPSPIWHRTINFLGDLARYKSVYLHEDSRALAKVKNWAPATRMYKEASLLAGHNGLYYNQLAIIAMYSESFSDALHFYLRSLTVKLPFQSAKDALTLLFEANRKRLENGNTFSRNQPANGATERIRLQSLFIRLHDILYTKISSVMASRSNDDARFLFGLAAINTSMSLAGKFSKREENLDHPDLLKEHLISITLHTLESCIKSQVTILREHYEARTTPSTHAAFLYISTTLMWIATMGDDWKSYLETPKYNRFWSSLAIFCTTLSECVADRTYADCPLTVQGILQAGGMIPEDWELHCSLVFSASHSKHEFDKISCGSSSEIDSFVGAHINDSGACCFQMSDPEISRARMWRILALARCIASKSNVFEYDHEQHRFIHQKKHEAMALVPSVEDLPPGSFESEEDVEYEPYGTERQTDEYQDDEDLDVGEEDDEAMRTLKALRNQLHGTYDSRTRMLASQGGDIRARSAPLNLVPGKTTVVFDTNLFLHSMKHVITIIESGLWVVSIPLVVLTELDGLKVGDNSTSIAAQQAVSYIEAEFGDRTQKRKKPWLKLQTSQGNFLHDLTIRTESWTTHVAQNQRRRNNDDVILQCCLHFKQKADPAAVDKTVSKVVLVTGDVNMKLKARTLGIDVRDRIPT
ncbi:hypothetical protein PhCBS80983_g02611 [Powellomyces hirtus]|uniref:PIN domain-containing protein n=1 Tax=Powellomyces hirtus TaxID=109895 RepID=A0A507E7K1_9FUNG|nr:hypothetical protein PhCBS80983_g02611 [Powellomyces hirtus]